LPELFLRKTFLFENRILSGIFPYNLFPFIAVIYAFLFPFKCCKIWFLPLTAMMDLWGGGHWADDAFPSKAQNKEKVPKIYND